MAKFIIPSDPDKLFLQTLAFEASQPPLSCPFWLPSRRSLLNVDKTLVLLSVYLIFD